MTRGRSRALLLLLAGWAVSGCSVVPMGDVYDDGRAPTCEYRGRPASPVVVLEAQAVPTATLLPCVQLLPAGWSVSNVSVRDGKGRFALDSDRAGPRAVTVVLTSSCRVSGATRVPSDEPGTVRYEVVGPVDTGVGYTGTRFYTFDGGCVRYEFRFSGEERAEPLAEATSALGFVTRDAVRETVRDRTDGRARLDPDD